MELLFLNLCKNCNFSLDSKTKKIVIEDCHNVTIAVNEKVLTQTLEIINSSNVTVNINVPISTITCDNSKNIELNFQHIDFFELVAWAKALDCKLTIGGNNIDVLGNLVNFDFQKDQIVTRKSSDGTIVSNLTRRDHAGRITDLV